jgi:hypothetical protein
MSLNRTTASVAWISLGLSTRMLQVVCATWFVASSSAWAADENGRFLEFANDFNTVTFDLSTVQIVQPGRFTVVETTIDNPGWMRVQLGVLATLRTYCARPDGQYPPPPDLFILGPPDFPAKNIEVRTRPPKGVSWEYPYTYLKLHSPFLFCEEYDEVRSTITNGIRSKDLYDCKRGLWGHFLHEDDDPGKAFVDLVPKGSRAFEFYLSVCRAVTHEAPYLPP